MNRFKQYIPAFVDGFDPVCFEFETTEDLLNNEFVIYHSKKNGFSHFAMSDNCLMKISDDGFDWRVLGYIQNPENIDLPEWEGWKFRAILENGKEVVLSDEVVSSCLDTLTLKDGTKAKRLLTP